MRRYPRTPLYLACVFFSLMALCVKLLTGDGHDLPVMQVAFFRSFLCLALIAPVLPAAFRSGAPCPQALLLRGLSGGLAMICYFHAIDRLTLSCAVLLNYTSPLWAALFAFLSLRERISLGFVMAVPAALTGIAVVVGAPGMPDDPGAYLLGLGSAVLAAGAYTALRGLRKSSPALVVAALAGVTCLLTGPFCYQTYVAPTGIQWALLWSCAACSALAQWFMTLGYRWSSTAAASTVGMATVATTSVLSLLLLGEPLSTQQLLGVTMLLWATLQAAPNTLLERALAAALGRAPVRV